MIGTVGGGGWVGGACVGIMKVGVGDRKRVGVAVGGGPKVGKGVPGNTVIGSGVMLAMTPPSGVGLEVSVIVAGTKVEGVPVAP